MDRLDLFVYRAAVNIGQWSHLLVVSLSVFSLLLHARNSSIRDDMLRARWSVSVTLRNSCCSFIDLIGVFERVLLGFLVPFAAYFMS